MKTSFYRYSDHPISLDEAIKPSPTNSPPLMTQLARIKKIARVALVSASLASVAGISLFSGQAQAAGCALNALAGCSIIAGDKTISNISITGGGFVPTANQNLDFSIASGAWVVSTNFAPDQNSTLTPSQANPAVLAYTITINDLTKYFDRVAIQGDDTTINGGTTSQTVSWGNGDPALVSTNGVNAGPSSISGLLQTINVSSSWYTDGVASFNNVSQKFTQKTNPPTNVPGPLPLLGLGAAFGMSRRLRRRIATQG